MDSNSFHSQRRLRESDDDSSHLWEALDSFFLLNSGSLVFSCSVISACVALGPFVRRMFLPFRVRIRIWRGWEQSFRYGQFALQDSYSGTYTSWFFEFAFVASTAAILCGAVSERMKIEAQLLSTLFLTTWVCPVVMRLVCSDGGWLNAWNDNNSYKDVGMIDFARASVVHLVRGVASLAGAAVVGRRVGRFDAHGKPQDIPGHSASLSTLGVLVLWFGWYGFNPGSALTLRYNGHAIAALCVVTTTLSAAAGCISTMIVVLVRNFIRKGRLKWDVIGAGNGVLAGLVAISASCAVVKPWAAIVIVIVAGIVYTGASYLMLNIFKLDDPVNAVSVHGFCGMWSLIAAAALADQDLCVEFGFSSSYQPGSYGFLLGGNGKYLAAALVGILAISGWVFVQMVVVFLILKRRGLLRVSAIEEHRGLDFHCGIDKDIQTTSADGQTALTETELVLINGSTSNAQDDEIHTLKTKLGQLEARFMKLEVTGRKA